MPIQRQTRFIRRLIYTLKRGFGFPVTFYKVTSETLNLETGVRTPVIEYHRVNKAVVLPEDLLRRFETDSVNKSFNYGAYYDSALQKLLIDPRGLADFNIDVDDYFIVDGQRFQVGRVFNLYNGTAILVIGRYVEGSKRYAITDVTIESTMQPTQTVARVV